MSSEPHPNARSVSPTCTDTRRRITRAVTAADAHGGVGRAARKAISGVSDNGPLSLLRLPRPAAAPALPRGAVPGQAGRTAPRPPPPSGSSLSCDLSHGPDPPPACAALIYPTRGLHAHTHPSAWPPGAWPPQPGLQDRGALFGHCGSASVTKLWCAVGAAFPASLPAQRLNAESRWSVSRGFLPHLRQDGPRVNGAGVVGAE